MQTPPPTFFVPKKQTGTTQPPQTRPPTENEISGGGNRDLSFQPGPPKETYTKPPPPLTQPPMEFGQEFEKLNISKSQQKQDVVIVNLREIQNLPRPLLGQNQTIVHQPDVAPLFSRYQGDEEIDFSKAQCPSAFCRATVQCVPSTPQVLSKWSLPFGAILRPFAPQGEEKIPVYNFGTCGVIRCFNCRTYINPFVSFHEDGRKWQCNMCKVLNQVHQDYYCPLDKNGKRVDLAKHPELLNGSIEYVAPKEYLSRTPQPPSFFFVIEVTKHTVESGMVATIADAILSCLDSFGKRTQVGFITFDETVHFYNLKKELSQPQMLVSGELSEAVLPIPNGLLVDLEDSKVVIKKFLTSLKTMFKDTQVVASCLGAALNCAGRVLGPVGGKLSVFIATLPTIGPNPLVNREAQNVEEKLLLSPGNKEYKELALIYSKDQISVDLYVGTSSHVDMSTLHCLPKYSCGMTHFYPGFSYDINGEKLYCDIQRALTKEMGFEAVMRVRVSTGLKIVNYYGNTFPRNAGLLGLPTVDEDAVFAIEIAHEGTLISSLNACIQIATLYTSSQGERRIRCQTVTLPITQSLDDMYRHADVNATVSLMGKMAIDESLRNGLSATRNKLRDWVVGTIKSFKDLSQQNRDFVLAPSIALLPLYVQSLAKSYALSSDTNIKVDLRIASGDVITNATTESFLLSIHPDLYAVHEKSENPTLTPLSYTFLNPAGIYLMDDGNTLYLWVGDKASKETEQDIFDAINYLSNPDKFPLSKQNTLGDYFVDLVGFCRKQSGMMSIRLIRQNGPLEKLFAKRLSEDKTPSSMGYLDFLAHLQSQSLI